MALAASVWAADGRAGGPGAVGGQEARGASEPESFWVDIPEAAYRFEMVAIPASVDGTVERFWMSRMEITWDAFDVYTFKLDEPGNEKADAVSRPSKPYIPPDRGFGHQGYAVISVSLRNAKEFCAWLSARTGKTFRLASEEEWRHACLAGSGGAYSFGDDAGMLGEYAWFEGNSDYSPQPVGKKKPNAWGLHDMHGNVQEWVMRADGTATTCGGSFRDPPAKLKASATADYQPTWQASDPQVPKSPWWLSDGPFVGFRVVCEE